MSPSQPPRLLDQLREAIRLKHFSLKTEKSYVYYVRDFIVFHNKQHPKDRRADDERAIAPPQHPQQFFLLSFSRSAIASLSRLEQAYRVDQETTCFNLAFSIEFTAGKPISTGDDLVPADGCEPVAFLVVFLGVLRCQTKYFGFAKATLRPSSQCRRPYLRQQESCRQGHIAALPR